METRLPRLKVPADGPKWQQNKSDSQRLAAIVAAAILITIAKGSLETSRSRIYRPSYGPGNRAGAKLPSTLSNTWGNHPIRGLKYSESLINSPIISHTPSDRGPQGQGPTLTFAQRQEKARNPPAVSAGPPKGKQSRVTKFKSEESDFNISDGRHPRMAGRGAAPTSVSGLFGINMSESQPPQATIEPTYARPQRAAKTRALERLGGSIENPDNPKQHEVAAIKMQVENGLNELTRYYTRICDAISKVPENINIRNCEMLKDMMKELTKASQVSQENLQAYITLLDPTKYPISYNGVLAPTGDTFNLKTLTGAGSATQLFSHIQTKITEVETQVDNIYITQRPADPTVQAPPAGDNTTNKVWKVDASLKPTRTLTESMSNWDRKQWENSVLAYLDTDRPEGDGNLTKANILLGRCIEDRIFRDLKGKWNDQNQIKDNIKEAFEYIDKSKNPNAVKITALALEPRTGEKFSHWSNRMHYEADNAGLYALTVHQMIALIIFQRHNDNEIKEKIAEEGSTLNRESSLTLAEGKEKVRINLTNKVRPGDSIAGLRNKFQSPNSGSGSGGSVSPVIIVKVVGCEAAGGQLVASQCQPPSPTSRHYTVTYKPHI